MRDITPDQKRFLDFSAERKFELSVGLYYFARKLKESWLKKLHPEWNREKIEEEIRKAFLYART